jgi:hypothetical protein
MDCDEVIVELAKMNSEERIRMEELVEEHGLSIKVDFERLVDMLRHEFDDEHDQFNSDAEADADALASMGWGTDEDYGGGMEHI